MDQNSIVHGGIIQLIICIVMILISIAIGLLWAIIMEKVRKLCHMNSHSKIRTVLCRLIFVVIVVFGVKALISPNFIRMFTMPFDGNRPPEMEYRFGEGEREGERGGRNSQQGDERPDFEGREQSEEQEIARPDFGNSNGNRVRPDGKGFASGPRGRNGGNIFDTIAIICLIIGVTHYIAQFFRKRKKKNLNGDVIVAEPPLSIESSDQSIQDIDVNVDK